MTDLEAQARINGRFRSLSRALLKAAAAIGALVAAGWLFGIPILVTVLPGVSGMSPVTAALFIFLAAGASAAQRRPGIAYAASYAAVLLGLLTMIERLYGPAIGPDTILWGVIGKTAPAESVVSIFTAAGFILAGVSLTLFARGRFRAAQLFCLGPLVISVLALAGYAFYVDASHIFNYRGMAVHTALPFVALGLGMLFAHPDKGAMRLVSSAGAGGFMARRLLPASVAVPLGMGWLRMKGEWLDLYSTEAGLLIFAMSNITVFVFIVWRYASRLDRIDAERFSSHAMLDKAMRALKTIGECNGALVKAEDEATLLDRICGIIVNVGGYRLAWVGYAEKAGVGAVRIASSAGYGALKPGDLAFSSGPGTEAGRGPFAEAVREARPVVCKDALNDPSFAPWRDEADALGYRSVLAVPLAVREGGVLAIYASEPDAFDAEELELLTQLKDDLSYGINALRLRAEHRRIDAENRLIHSVAVAVSGSETSSSVVESAIRRICDATGWVYGEACFPVPGGDGRISCDISYSVGESVGISAFKKASERLTFGPGAGLPGRVLASARAEWVRDVGVDGAAYLRSEAAKGAGLHGAFAVPITDGGEVLAVLIFYMPEPTREDEARARLVSTVAAQLGPVMRRKLAEDALRESETKYRTLLENLPQRIFLKDPSSVYVSCNDNYARDLGIAPGRIRGATDYNFFPMELAEKFRADDGKVVETGRILNVEEPYVVDGVERWVRTIKVPVRDKSGAVSGVLGIFWDITDVKKAEAEKARLEAEVMHMQKMEAIGRLTGSIAHDFNNHLMAIIGNASLIGGELGDDSRGRHFVEQIIASADRAAKLTRGLLAFSRKQALDVRLLDLNDLVRGVEKLLTRLIGEDVELSVMAHHEPLLINADAGQMEQVLMNLATNARDAMPGGGRLEMAAGVAEITGGPTGETWYVKPGRYALLTVTDTGTGIDERLKGKIFEPFFTTKGADKGTGLGLSIVYGIIKQHGGYIDFDSAMGKGTAFRIYIPLAVPAETAPAAGEEEGPVPRGGSETVLVAEDDPQVRRLIRTLLEEFGYYVIEAADGEEAVSKFKADGGKIGILILDTVMPRKNGAEAYADIAAADPKVKALFMSGYGEEVVHAKGIHDAGFHFISKPFMPLDFIRAVRRILDEKEEAT